MRLKEASNQEEIEGGFKPRRGFKAIQVTLNSLLRVWLIASETGYAWTETINALVSVRLGIK